MSQKSKNQQLQENYTRYSESLLRILFSGESDDDTHRKHSSPRGTLHITGSSKTFRQILDEVLKSLEVHRQYTIKDELKKILKEYETYMLEKKMHTIPNARTPSGLRVYDHAAAEQLSEKLHAEIVKIWPVLWFRPKKGDKYSELEYGREIKKYLDTDTKMLPVYNIDDIHLGARLRAVKNLKPPDKMKTFNDLVAYRRLPCPKIYKRCNPEKQPNGVCFYYHGEDISDLASAMIKYSIYLKFLTRRNTKPSPISYTLSIPKSSRHH